MHVWAQCVCACVAYSTHVVVKEQEEVQISEGGRTRFGVCSEPHTVSFWPGLVRSACRSVAFLNRTGAFWLTNDNGGGGLVARPRAVPWKEISTSGGKSKGRALVELVVVWVRIPIRGLQGSQYCQSSQCMAHSGQVVVGGPSVGGSLEAATGPHSHALFLAFCVDCCPTEGGEETEQKREVSCMSMSTLLDSYSTISNSHPRREKLCFLFLIHPVLAWCLFVM